MDNRFFYFYDLAVYASIYMKKSLPTGRSDWVVDYSNRGPEFDFGAIKVVSLLEKVCIFRLFLVLSRFPNFFPLIFIFSSIKFEFSLVHFIFTSLMIMENWLTTTGDSIHADITDWWRDIVRCL